MWMATSSEPKSLRDLPHSHPPESLKKSIKEMARLRGRGTSWSSTYRIAVELGLRKSRRNHSRYDAFWRAANWSLPDCAIAKAWGVDRSNVRTRRIRCHMPRARWTSPVDETNAAFQATLKLEIVRATRFDGPRPDPAQRRKVSKRVSSQHPQPGRKVSWTVDAIGLPEFAMESLRRRECRHCGLPLIDAMITSAGICQHPFPGGYIAFFYATLCRCGGKTQSIISSELITQQTESSRPLERPPFLGKATLRR